MQHPLCQDWHRADDLVQTAITRLYVKWRQARAVSADARHAARLTLVREGLIGEPTSVQVSSTHLYHAVSLIRGLLGIGFDAAEVRASAFEAPLANPLGFDGWTGDDTPQR
ncbi:hypothetical protein [Nonomuraea turkmeniaca]|nr:hypothetical protein [Nonomuraea turkmeniaca]